MMDAYLAQARAVLLSANLDGEVSLWKANRPGAGALPAVVLSLVSTSPVRALNGEVSNEARISVTVISIKYSECVALSNSVKIALNDYRGIPIEGLPTVRFWLTGSTHEIKGEGGESDVDDNQSFVIIQDYLCKNTP